MNEERSLNDRDNEMRKQHAIMQAQRRQLQASNIERFNKDQTLHQRVVAEKERKQNLETRSPEFDSLGNLKDMPVSYLA